MPQSILAYLSSIGGGSKLNIFSDELFFKNTKSVLTDLVSNFDETKISGRSIKLNQELLDNLNKKFLKLKLNTDRTDLVAELKILVQTKKINVNPYYLTDEYLSNLIYWTQDRIHKLSDLVEDSQFSFLWTDMSNFNKNKASVQLEQIVELVQHLNGYLKNSSTNLEDKEKLKQELKSLFENINNNKKVNYWQLTRLVLIGSLQGPSIVEVLNILGKKNACYRLKIAETLSLNDLKLK